MVVKEGKVKIEKLDVVDFDFSYCFVL